MYMLLSFSNILGTLNTQVKFMIGSPKGSFIKYVTQISDIFKTPPHPFVTLFPIPLSLGTKTPPPPKV